MMRSLHARHLLNGIVIIVIGILVLGALLSLSIYQSKTQAVGEELERTALDLLGYIEYDNGTFTIMEPNKTDSDAFLNSRKLRTSGKARFAYLWDAAQQKIIWDSLDNDDVDQQSVKNNFALFDFDALLKITDGNAPGQGFSPALARKAYSTPVAAGEKPTQYMVAVQKFVVNVGDGKKVYLFVVADSMAGVKTDAYELIKVLVVLLLITAALLFIAQLLFSWWVMAPIRKFEQEVAAIAHGDKAALDHDYPNELKSVQKAINALLTGGKQE